MNDERLWHQLKEAGLTDAGAAGLLGNLQAESGLDPECLEKLCIIRLAENGKGTWTGHSYTEAIDAGRISLDEFLHPLPGKKYGYGLAQWTTEGRKRALWDYAEDAGTSIGDLDMQAAFLLKELKESYPSVWKVLTTTESTAEASDIVLTKYEAPADSGAQVAARRKLTDKVFAKFVVKGGEPMAFDRQKVIDLAKAELGYIEKSAAWYKQKGAAGLYDKIAGAGKDNYTKYGYEMHRLYPAVMDFPAPWCDSTIDWLFMQAYGVSNAKKLLGGDFDDYTVMSAQLYKGKNAWKPAGTIPELGWQIFFKNDKRICHTGLVVGIEKDGGVWYIITIEGNTSAESGVVANGGCVRQKRYRADYDKIAGYGVPPYGDEDAARKIAFTPHWIHDGKDWYYRVAEHENAHGWQMINGHWYFFAENGRMLTGTHKIGAHWYTLATAEMDADFEGALMKTDKDGALRIWNL